MAIVDSHGLLLEVRSHAANHHNVTLVKLSTDLCMIEAKPENLIDDRACDSDKMYEDLRQEGIEIISSPRRGRVNPRTQDDRRLRRGESR